MCQLAVAAVDRPPLFGHGQDGVDFGGHEAVDGVAPGSPVDEGALVAEAGPPAVHPVVGDAPQGARPGVVEPGGRRLPDGLEDLLLDLGGGPRRERPYEPQPAFPRTMASSMA